MSRSFVKTPITGIACCDSEKSDKRLAHRIARRNIKQCLSIAPYTFTHIDRKAFRFNNIFCFGKDGKHYYGHLKYSDVEHYRKLRRK